MPSNTLETLEALKTRLKRSQFNDQVQEGSMMARATKDPRLMTKINKARREQQRKEAEYEGWAGRGFIVWEGD